MNYSQGFIDKFVGQFVVAPISKDARDHKPCRIRINGKIITLGHKSVWARKAFAKSALTNFLGHRFSEEICEDLNLTKAASSYGYEYYPNELEKTTYKQFIQDMQDEGILEFEEIDN